jgi:hypothetical protein
VNQKNFFHTDRIYLWRLKEKQGFTLFLAVKAYNWLVWYVVLVKKELRKVKKYRFQLLHAWIVEHFDPCRVADIGGGKGLLALFLNQSGFQSIVIDPFDQSLPVKYKNLNKQKFKISKEESVPRINAIFEKEMAKDFNLLIGLHAHGSNMKIIEATAEHKKDFILLPCCVIDEPITPHADINWFDSLEQYANLLGLKTKRFELNFRGQNKGFYSKRET